MVPIKVFIDDVADSAEFARKSKMLHALHIRGRHNLISAFTATQKFSARQPMARVTAMALYVYRLRNNKVLESSIDDVSVVIITAGICLIVPYGD